MKLQKFILCAAAALAAFGIGLGLLEIVGFFDSGLPFLNREVQTVRPLPAPTVVFKTLSAQAEEAPDESQITGVYSVIGSTPAGFDGFYVEIYDEDYDEKNDKIVPVKLTGSLTTNNEYKFSRLDIDDKKISFATGLRKGVSYEFNGIFVNEPFKYKSVDGYEFTTSVVLRGRLTRLRNGRIDAVALVQFEKDGC